MMNVLYHKSLQYYKLSQHLCGYKAQLWGRVVVLQVTCRFLYKTICQMNKCKCIAERHTQHRGTDVSCLCHPSFVYLNRVGSSQGLRGDCMVIVIFGHVFSSFGLTDIHPSILAPPRRQLQLKLAVWNPMHCLRPDTLCILHKWLENVTWEKTIFFFKHNSLEHGAKTWNYANGIVAWVMEA